MTECDYLIVGGGDTGISLAESLNKLNKSVVLVETHKLGGGTLNNIVIPKKQFYKEAKKFSNLVSYLSDHGDIEQRLYEAKRILSQKIQKNIVKKYQENLDRMENLAKLKILFGEAKLLANNTASIQLEDKNIIVRYKACLLSVGKDFINPQNIVGLGSIDYLTKYTIFKLEVVPNHLAIIGLTIESMEVASFYSHLGIKVTIFEEKTKSQILSTIDRTMASFLVNKLLFNFVDIHFETKVSELKNGNGKIILNSHNKPLFTSSHVYIHVKESFDTNNSSLSKVRIKTTLNGISVDSNNKTNYPNIYAFGSCNDQDQSKKLVRAKIDIFVENEKKQLEIKHKKFSTQLIINTASMISYKPRQESVSRLITFELEYFLDSIGVGMGEVQAKGKYGPRVKVVLITNKQQSEFVKLIYFVSSKRLLGYWATSYFKTHFHSLLSFAMITKSNSLSAIDVIQTHLEDFEKRVT